MLTPTNSKITVASHVFSHAGVLCMQIQESMKGGGGGGYSTYISRGSGGMLQTIFEIFRASGAI